MPPASTAYSPQPQQQQLNPQMQSPNYYTPNTSPINYGQQQYPNSNFNNQPQYPNTNFNNQPQFDPSGQQPPQGYPQGQQNMMGNNFGMNPMMQDMAFQYGQKLADQGKELVNKEFEKYVSVTKLKYYFAVDNRYVMNKLRLLFFPFAHKDWSLKYDQENAVQPRYDLNAPDLYIPTMGYITYVVLAGFILGICFF